MRATRFDCLVRFDLECRARLRSHQRATNARIIHRSDAHGWGWDGHEERLWILIHGVLGPTSPFN